MRLIPWEYGVRNLSRSALRLALGVAGSGLVVLLILSAAAFVRGMQKSLHATGGRDNVILLGAGSEESFERSEIAPAVPGLVSASVSGIKSRLGVPFVSPEVFLQTSVKESRDAARSSQIIARGVTPTAFLVHGQVRISSGRAPVSGRDEVVLGSRAAAQLGWSEERMAIGGSIFFDDRAWTIVGRFDAPGTVMESEIWAPLSDLQIAARRDNLSCVVVTLDQADFDDIDAFARQRLDLELVALRETDYYAGLSRFYRPIQAMAWSTAILIATGGLLGGLNTMYAAFAGRVREVGALQVVGFSRAAIVVSLIQESTLICTAGTLAGAALAMIALDGLTVRFSMGVFGLVVDSSVLLIGLLAGVGLGIVGALPAALRCLRMPVSVALKAQ
ncbi:MAG: ABC transporter permease [Tepidisphaeraceae bacterium]